MDLDPSVEPELDSFSLTLPLPYRVALIIVLGVSPCPEGRMLLISSKLFGRGAQTFITWLSSKSQVLHPWIRRPRLIKS